MKTFRFAAVALLVMLPLATFAQSTSGSSESSLLAQLTALEQEISALSGATSTASVSATPVSASTPSQSTVTGLCPDLYRTLSIGSSGADVIGLQEFLASQGIFHAEVTGYFGTVTQLAVETWQSNNAIVSYGTPETTGYGVVGPHTRTAMESLCGGSGQSTAAPSQCLQTYPPTTECPTNWKPILDSNGCTEYYQCAIPLPGATTTTTTTSSATTTAASCPVAVQPICSGTVESFQTANGCQAYECVL